MLSNRPQNNNVKLLLTRVHKVNKAVNDRICQNIELNLKSLGGEKEKKGGGGVALTTAEILM